MSALTKVFVVLHVVLSLVLVSGMVVFVNKVEDFNKQATTAKAETARERAAKEAALAETAAVSGERDRAVSAANARAIANEQAYNNSLTQIADLNNQLQQAKLASDKAQTDLANAVLAMKAAQEAQKAAEEGLLASRKENDDLQRKYSDALVAVTDQTNKLDVMNARYRKLQEDATSLQSRVDELQAGGRTTGLRAGGGAGAAPASGSEAAATGTSDNVNIKGVVRSKKNIQNVEYATISVGSADNVTKGMRFAVIDRAGNRFLGYLTVDSVDYNESTGHLTGPAVNQVQPGSEVVTQLQ